MLALCLLLWFGPIVALLMFLGWHPAFTRKAYVGVILNLTLWFGLHVLFAELEEFTGHGMALSLPVWQSLDYRALVLALGAWIALRFFKTGMMLTLCAFSAAGVLIA